MLCSGEAALGARGVSLAVSGRQSLSKECLMNPGPLGLASEMGHPDLAFLVGKWRLENKASTLGELSQWPPSLENHRFSLGI